jgi:hypothetical protein
MEESEKARYPFAMAVHKALQDAVELSDVNMSYIVEGPGPMDFMEYAKFVGALLKVVQEEVVKIAMHVDDLESEVRRLKDE